MNEALTQYLEEGRKQNSIILPEDKFRPGLLVSIEKSNFGCDRQRTGALLRERGFFRLNLRYGVDLLRHLNSDKPVYNGLGKEIEKPVVRGIFYEMVGVGNPDRVEWFDDIYSLKDGKLQVTRHIIQNGELKEITEPLEDCLMEKKKISLKSWLESANSQGLPTEKTKCPCFLSETESGRLDYSYPEEDTGVCLSACSGYASIFFSYLPEMKASPTVRPTKIMEQ